VAEIAPSPVETGVRDANWSHEIVPLDDDTLANLIHTEIWDSISNTGTELSDQRRENLSMYHGRPFGNEQVGRSQAQLTDIQDTIEWIMPSLVRMFLGGDQVVRFKPSSADDVEKAKQASDYMNEVFLQQEDGFRVTYDWMKTALLEKNSTAKAYYEERTTPEFVELSGVTEVELATILDDQDTEMMEETIEPTGNSIPIEDPETGQILQADTFDVQIRRTVTRKRLRVLAIPPEEFLIGRREVFLNDETGFACHRVRMRVSDLIALGIDEEVALAVPSDDYIEFDAGRSERWGDDDSYPSMTGDRADAVAREVWVNDCWMRVDYDGDGFTELRHVLSAGDSSQTILINEYASHSPFADITPIPNPHKWTGNCPADQVKDLQFIRSTLLRQMLDNVYLQNNGRYEVVEGEVEIDDLLSSLPGGIVRVQQPGMVRQLDTPQLPPSAFAMMEYLEGVKEQRTGITRYNQGTDASTLNKTAFGIGAIMEAANQRIELIARVFAEGGFKRLFRILLRLMIEHPVKDQVVKLRGSWTPIDSEAWDPEWDLDIEVGLGMGQTQQRVQSLTAIMEAQKGAQAAGLGGLVVSPDQFYNAAHELQLALGFKAEGFFFKDPKGQDPEPAPNPEMEKIKQDEVSDQRRHDLEGQKIQLDAARIQQDGEIKRYALELQAALDRDKLASQERIAEMKIRADIEKADMALETAEAKAQDDDSGEEKAA